MYKEFLIPTVLATGIVIAALWVADQSLKPSMSEPAQQAMEEGSTGSAVPQMPQRSGHSESEDANLIWKEEAASHAPGQTTGISKCIIDGKTVYSDQGCPDGIKGRSVALHDNAGFVSPQKENLAELTARRRASEQMHALQVQQQVEFEAHSKKFECGELDRRIAHLDAMARQPQTRSMQDWIRAERKAVRDRQFAIRC